MSLNANFFKIQTRRREKRAKFQTESTQKIENAIEMVENTMEDSIRLTDLKEKNSALKYPSKPKLDESQVMLNNDPRRTLNRSLSARQSRTRSSSVNGRTYPKDKFAHVKPKTQTRIQTARTDADNSKLNGSILNDSASLRENIYNEWYMKKMEDAKANLKFAQLRQRDGEEEKAQVFEKKNFFIFGQV